MESTSERGTCLLEGMTFLDPMVQSQDGLASGRHGDMPGRGISWVHPQALQRVESQKERVKASHS